MTSAGNGGYLDWGGRTHSDTRGRGLTLRVDAELTQLALLIKLAELDPLTACGTFVGLQFSLNLKIVSLPT